jgi:hypothetical protein
LAVGIDLAQININAVVTQIRIERSLVFGWYGAYISSGAQGL